MIKSIAVIGYGKVGSTIAKSFCKSNILSYIVVRSVDNFVRPAEYPDFVAIVDDLNKFDFLPDVFFITVDDNSIELVAENLAENLQYRLKGKIVVHTSGTRTKSILNACEKFGAVISAAHPYQTFYYPDESILKGIYWGIESEKYEEIAGLVHLTGGEPLNLNGLDEEQKILYHSSAVFSSNFYYLLLYLSQKCLDKCGFSELGIQKRIIETTVDNFFDSWKNEGKMPLTGPIARLDAKTVEKQMNVLKIIPGFDKHYSEIAALLLEIMLDSAAFGINSDKKEDVQTLMKVLKR